MTSEEINVWKNTDHGPTSLKEYHWQRDTTVEGNWSKQDAVSTYQIGQMVHAQIADHEAWQQLMFGGDQFSMAS